MSKFLSHGLILAAITLMLASVAQGQEKKAKAIQIKHGDELIIIEVDSKTGEYKVRPYDPKGGKVIHLIGNLAKQEKASGTTQKQEKKRVIVRKTDGPKSGQARAIMIDDAGKVIEIENDHVIRIRGEQGSAQSGEPKKVIRKRQVILRKGDGNQEQESASDHRVKGKIPAEVLEVLKKHHVELGDHDVDVRVQDLGNGKKVFIRSNKDDGGRKEEKEIELIVEGKGKVNLGHWNAKKGESNSYPLVDEDALAKSIKLAFGKNSSVQSSGAKTIKVHGKKIQEKAAHGIVIVSDADGEVKDLMKQIKIIGDVKDIKMGDLNLHGIKKIHGVDLDPKNIKMGFHVIPGGKHSEIHKKIVELKDGKNLQMGFHVVPQDQKPGVYERIIKGDGKNQIIRYEIRKSDAQQDSKKSNKVRYEWKVDSNSKKGGSPKVIDLRVEGDHNKKAGEYYFKVDGDKIEKSKTRPSQGAYRMKFEPKAKSETKKSNQAVKWIHNKDGKAMVFETPVRSTSSGLNQRVDKIEKRLMGLEKKIDLLLKKIDR